MNLAGLAASLVSARLVVETAEPRGRFLGLVPARPVTAWACLKS